MPCWDSATSILEKQKQVLKLPLVSCLPCTTKNNAAFSPQYMPPYGIGVESAAAALQEQLTELSDNGSMSSQEASSVAIRGHWGAGKSKLIRILNKYPVIVNVSLASGPTLPLLQLVLINGQKKLLHLVDSPISTQGQFELYFKFQLASVRLIKVFFMVHIFSLRDFLAAVKSSTISEEKYKEAFIHFNANEAGTTLNQKLFFELMPHAETQEAYLELEVKCRKVIAEIGTPNFFFAVEEFGTLESCLLLDGLFFPAKSLDAYCKLSNLEKEEQQPKLLKSLPSLGKGFSYIFKTAFVEFLATMKIPSALTSTVSSSGDMEPLGSPRQSA